MWCSSGQVEAWEGRKGWARGMRMGFWENFCFPDRKRRTQLAMPLFLLFDGSLMPGARADDLWPWRQKPTYQGRGERKHTKAWVPESSWTNVSNYPTQISCQKSNKQTKIKPLLFKKTLYVVFLYMFFTDGTVKFPRIDLWPSANKCAPYTAGISFLGCTSRSSPSTPLKHLKLPPRTDLEAVVQRRQNNTSPCLKHAQTQFCH